MGDNSVDMIPPALDNGELNSTMANQIAYSPKETILEGYFCTQMVPASCDCVNLLLCFTLTVNSKCHIGKVIFYRFKHVLLI